MIPKKHGHKWNKTWVGLVAGFIGTFVGFWVWCGMYLLSHPSRGIQYFTHGLFLNNTGNQPKIISLSLIVTALVFYWFYQKKYDYAARGVLFTLLIFGVVVVYMKYIR
ncbi:MAG: hypothetical protein COA57_05335 [Flavobacteriales bacterium]|nr:MAG: hypothetical protein COA57_05335 [Flavobacteriales bacterium]